MRRRPLSNHVIRRAFRTALVMLGVAGPVHGQSTAFADAHVHLNDPEGWMTLMDEAGIESAVVFRGRDIDNLGLLDAARRWPGRIFPFVSISPEHREYRPGWEANTTEVVAVVDSLFAVGRFYGIGEISVSHFPASGFPEADYDPNGRTMRGVLEAARRHGVPVNVHLEVTRLREFEALLSDFPDVTIIWAHGGYTPLFLAERMLERFPNLIYELSARTWRDHPRSPDYTILSDGTEVWPEWIALIERMPDRFLVGTDASLRSRDSDREKIDSVQNFLRGLEPETRQKVARENLRAILGVD